MSNNSGNRDNPPHPNPKIVLTLVPIYRLALIGVIGLSTLSFFGLVALLIIYLNIDEPTGELKGFLVNFRVICTHVLTAGLSGLVGLITGKAS